MPEAFICDGVRTPIGRYAGALARVRTDDLAALPIKALMKRHPNMDWSSLDDVYYGCANQAGEDNRNVARMALLLAGLPASVPGATINRLCSSGLNAVGLAAQGIRAGEIDFVPLLAHAMSRGYRGLVDLEHDWLEPGEAAERRAIDKLNAIDALARRRAFGALAMHESQGKPP